MTEVPVISGSACCLGHHWFPRLHVASSAWLALRSQSVYLGDVNVPNTPKFWYRSSLSNLAFFLGIPFLEAPYSVFLGSVLKQPRIHALSAISSRDVKTEDLHWLLVVVTKFLTTT